MMEYQTATVQGIPMRWAEAGDGFPVVLLHGIPTSPALWRYVMPRIHGRALAWEMVGYGESIPQSFHEDISVAAQSGHLAAWLDHIGVSRAVFVGHDLGGGVLQIMAVHHPERFAGLLLTNSIGYDSWPIPSVKRMRAMGGALARLPAPAFRFLLWTLIRRGHDSPERASEALAVHWEPYRRQGGAAAMIRQVRSLDVNDTLAIQEALPHVGIPSRVVWGAADQFQKIRYGERLAEDLEAPLRPIPGGKHFTPEDHPAQIAEAVNDLIAVATAV